MRTTWMGVRSTAWLSGLVLLGCDLASRSVGDFVVPRPQNGEQLASEARGVSHLVGPPEVHRAIGLGDLDGDGYDDIAVVQDDYSWSGPQIHPEDSVGRVFLIYGRRDGLPPNVDLARIADAVITTPARVGFFTIEPLGDIDGDGLADVVVAHTDNHERDPGEPESPQMRVHFLWGDRDRREGAASITDLTVALELPDSWAVPIAAGDVDGDGANDMWLLAGSQESSVDQLEFSGLYLFRGPAQRWALPLALDAADATIAEDDPDREPWSAQGVGDLDGDGLDDVAIVSHVRYEAEPELSRVSLFYGRTQWPADQGTSAPDAWIAADGYLEIGQGRGDIHGDALADIAVSSLVTTSQEASDIELLAPAIVLDGTPMRYAGEIEVEWVGGDAKQSLCMYLIATIGDVDGDGRDDVATTLCQHGDPYQEGQDLVLAYGWAESSSTLRRSDTAALFRGSPAYMWSYPGGAGDFNGDGFADYLIVSEHRDSGNDDSSAIHLVYGAARE